jgi:hypothetical protein
MTTDRSRAYARVARTLTDVGPAKLHDLEQRRIRNAADALVFAGPDEYEALTALVDVEQLTQELIRSGRWMPERAWRLADDIAACGPTWIEPLPAARAA